MKLLFITTFSLLISHLLNAGSLEETQKLAEKGDSIAQNDLGALYYNGKGVRLSYSEAIKWFTRAAEQGHKLAKYNLRMAQDKLRELDQTITKAEAGDSEAQNSLGLIFYYGWELPKNYQRALEWFKKAADQGHSVAKENVNMVLTSIKKDAVTLYDDAIWHLSDKNKNIDQDKKEGIRSLTLSAEWGYVNAQRHLGMMYYLGRDVSQNYNTSAVWFRKAADQLDPISMNYLGEMYRDGKGVQQNYQKALALFKRAALMDHISSKTNFALMLVNGHGIPTDYATALDWFLQAAKHGDLKAQHYIAVMYFNGNGVIEDYVKAYAWSLIAKANVGPNDEINVANAELSSIIKSKLVKEQIAIGQEMAGKLFQEIKNNQSDNPVNQRFD